MKLFKSNFANMNFGHPDSLARKLIVAMLGSAGARLLGVFLSFLVGLQLARYLGPAEYGQYGTVMALTTLLLVPAQLGLPQLVTRELSVFVTRGALNEAKGTLLWLTAVVFGASAIVALAIALFYVGPATARSEAVARAYYWGLASIPLFALSNLGVGMLRGYHRVVGAQLFDVLFRPAIFAILLFGMAAISVRLDAASAMAMQTIAAALTLGLCFWSLFALTPREIKRAKAVAQWRSWAAFAAPTTGTELLRTIDGQYAILIFGALASLDQVGIYRVALAVSAFIVLPSTVLTLVIMPYVAQLHSSGDLRKLQMIASGSALALFATTLLATVALALVGKQAITLVFGLAYQDSWLPLVVISGAYTISGFFGSSTIILMMTGFERAVTVAYAAGVAVGVSLTLALYSRFGINAAAMAIVGSELVRSGILWSVARDKLGLDISAFSAIFGLTRLSLSGRPQIV
jgi:O-antigen/teichoic acid export membrane protein